MSEKRTLVQETTQEGSILAAAGSTTAAELQHLPVNTTLDYSSGQAMKKVEPFHDQAKSIVQFFHSGCTAKMEDKSVSVMMMNEAVPLIDAGTGKFGFVYDKRLVVKSSCFERNKNFALKHACGAGALGQVHAFLDSQSGLPFVRKRLKKGKSLRKEEVLSLVKLDHPGVVKLFALLCFCDTVDLLMQNAGYPLQSCLREFWKKQISPTWYWKAVVDLAKQGFEALSYIHREGVCHNDVKPENWLVRQVDQCSLRLVLADFGSCVFMDSRMTFTLALTPEYWSPEIWRLTKNYLQHMAPGSVHKPEAFHFKPQAGFDTYAMGLCVYYMATQKHLLKVLEARQNTPDRLVHPHLLHGSHDHSPKTNHQLNFRIVLMTQYSHELPKVATTGHWLFPNIPSWLLEVIRQTLNPDPTQRWTDEQAASYLSVNHETNQSCEGDFKTPTPVMDTSSTHTAETGQAEPCNSPVPETSSYGAAPAVDVTTSVAHTKQPEILSSTGVQRFQQNISPFMKCWDRHITGFKPSPTAGLQGQAMATIIPQPTSSFQACPDDNAIRSTHVSQQVNAPTPDNVFTSAESFTRPIPNHKPQAHPKPVASRPGSNDSSPHLMSLRAPSTTVLSTQSKENTEEDRDIKTMDTMLEKVPDPLPPSELTGLENGRKGWAGGGKVDQCISKAGWDDDEGKMTCATVMKVTGNLQALSMQTKQGSASKRSVGGAKRTAVKAGLEANEHEDVASKVRAYSRITQHPNRGKQAFVLPGKNMLHARHLASGIPPSPGKNMPCARQPVTGMPASPGKNVPHAGHPSSGISCSPGKNMLQARQSASGIPFFVASSSRPKLSGRTMAGLASKSEGHVVDHSSGGCSYVSGEGGIVAAAGDTLLARPQAIFYAECVDTADSQAQGGVVPVTGLDRPVSTMTRSGLVITLPRTPVPEYSHTPQSVGVNTEADPCLATPGHHQTSVQLESVAGLQLEAIDPANVDELLQLLDASQAKEQPLPLSNSTDVGQQEQLLPAMPTQPPPLPLQVVQEGLSDMMEDIHMTVTGNIPNFVQLFD